MNKNAKLAIAVTIAILASATWMLLAFHDARGRIDPCTVPGSYAEGEPRATPDDHGIAGLQYKGKGCKPELEAYEGGSARALQITNNCGSDLLITKIRVEGGCVQLPFYFNDPGKKSEGVWSGVLGQLWMDGISPAPRLDPSEQKTCDVKSMSADDTCGQVIVHPHEDVSFPIAAGQTFEIAAKTAQDDKIEISGRRTTGRKFVVVY